MYRPFLALTLAGLTWGLTVPLSKVVLEWLDPAWTTVARFGLAAPLLALIARGTLRRSATPAIAAWGAVGFGLVIVLQNIGIQRTSVTHAALILGSVPVLVALTAAAAGRGSAGRRAWTGFALAAGGMTLVAGHGGGDATVTGDLLMLASAVLSALTIEAQSRLLPGRDPVGVTAVQMAAAALAALPIALLAGDPPNAMPGAGPLLAIAALCTAGALPYALYAYGQARVSAETAGAFVNLEPLIGAAVGATILGDPFGPTQMIGGVAILGGLLLSVLPQPRRDPLVAAATSG